MRKSGLGTLAVFVLAIAMAVPCMGQGTDGLSEAPINQGFVDYLTGAVQAQGLQDDENVPGLVPEPIAALFGGGVSANATAAAAPPASYDLRALGKLTPIRDQGGCGSCWSFATYGSLESYLMPGHSWNLSENNLKNESGFDISCCSGGNRTMSTAYLARWAGPIAEVDDPYNQSSCYSPTDVSPVQHVQNILFIPNRTGSLDNAALKEAVMSYGAVYTTYYHSSTYYRSATRAYYYGGGSNANHAVCIVGWDDNFASTNFTSAPSGSGAFLCRNSWGTYWGDGGYFWMSYYDARLGRSENAVFTADPTTNYDSIYQYDELGWISSIGYSNTTAWFANVFTAASNTQVKAASWYCPVPNCSYQLYVYTNTTSGPVSASPAASTSGTLAEAGYRTVTLPTPVSVSAGQKFSVVVRLTTPGYSYPVAIERPYSGYSSAATASAGQSYISSSGTSWSDLATYYASSNVCLKAFTGGSSAPTPGALSVTPTDGLSSSGNQGGPFTPSSKSYTIRNTGGASINWTAAKTQGWLTLSATSGSLTAGQSTTVTVSVSTTANALAAGSYSDTISFTNTTNGEGNTTRSASLAVNAVNPGALSVTPSDGLVSSGKKGGPFSPASTSYTLTNTGGVSINWTAAKTQSWVSLSRTGGSLAAGQSATVTVSLNSYANSLAVGNHSDTVSFANATNGQGNTTRSVGLTVTSTNPGALSVTPITDLSATANTGGAVTPSSQVYTIKNTGSTWIGWTATKTQSWVSLSHTSGSLAPGQSLGVTVSINSNAYNLAAGPYSDIVKFTNVTNGSGNTTRGVFLTITGPGTSDYSVARTGFNWIDPSMHPKLNLKTNSATYAISIPFSFEFYGTSYNKIYVGSNGMVGFASSSMTSYSNVSIPRSYAPNAVMYAYWDALNQTMGGSMHMATIGTAPNRKVVVSWLNVPHASLNSAKFSFQVVMCEGSNNIIFQYLNVSPTNAYGGGRSATIGIENQNGTAACRWSYNQAGAVSNEDALLFTKGAVVSPGRTVRRPRG